MLHLTDLTRKRIHIIVLTLYVAVLVGSAMHIHGSDYNPLADPKFTTPCAGESAHHSTTIYSACYIAAFASTSSLELNSFYPFAYIQKVFIPLFDCTGEIQLSLTSTNPLRGPPVI